MAVMFRDGKKLNNIWEKVMIALSVLVIAGAVVGTVIATRFCVNQSDDYSHALEIGVFNAGFFSYLKTSFLYMISMYKGWAGNFTSMFLQGWLSPLNNGGLLQLRAVMLVNVLLFFASVILFLYHFTGVIFEGRNHIRIVIIAVFMFVLMNYRCYHEIFYWFSGATSYSFPLSILYISLILYIFRRKNRAVYVLALICAFIAGGGSFTLAGPECYAAFLVCVYSRIAGKRFTKDSIGFFLAAFLGTLANVVAPGNYVRLGLKGDDATLTGAAKDTVTAAHDEFIWLFHDTNFIIFLMLMVLIGMIISRGIKVNLTGYYTVTVLGLAMPLVSIFPVVMGYAHDFLANRTLFIVDQTMYLSLLNGALCLGVVLQSVMGEGFFKQAVFTFATAAVVFMCVSGFSFKNLQSVRTLVCDMNGTFSNYQAECHKMEEYFGSCSGKDVVVDVKDVPAGPDNFSCFYLENGWVNTAIAEYYGMNSLTVTDDQ